MSRVSYEAELVGGPFCGHVTTLSMTASDVKRGQGNPLPGVIMGDPSWSATYMYAGYLTGTGKWAYRFESATYKGARH